MNRQWRIVLALLAIAVVVLSACTAPAAPAAPAGEAGSEAAASGEAMAGDKVLRVNLGTFPDILDP